MIGGTAGVIFNSRDRSFRSPVGPIRADESVTFRILISPDVGARSVSLVVIYDHDNSRANYPLTENETAVETDDYLEYTGEVFIHDPGLYWYGFEIMTDCGPRYVGKDAENHAIVADPAVFWQQTVFRRKYEVPAWIEGGVIYHIFVDRFNHVGEYVRMDDKITRTDWGGVPEYRPNHEGRIVNNDFFGGNLQGIIAKLPYLKELGVTCLYLSPIFSAYSNHKYDTCDYRKIDPMFGTEEDFRELCAKAAEYGMRVILDGVFSHTGSDSVYFDRWGRFGGGAWNNPKSRYRSWYYFDQGGRYETWWGIDTLPRINKNNPDYENFICGEDGVARYWLRQGASGWRLDVADELPNRFLRALAAGVKAEKPDSILLGEVWEDASNKSAYNERKNYFKGDKLDSVMNYPFRNGIIDFVRNGNAHGLACTVEQILENYPPDVVHCLMNILGTHDTERILTALGGKDLGPNPSREAEAREKMDPIRRARAIRMLKIAAVVQMTLPGVPCVYYGDEAGMEGYKDPFNRCCFPWGSEDPDLTRWYERIIRIRREHASVYRTGAYRTVASIEGLYAFERYETDETVGDTGRLPCPLGADDDNDGVRMVTAANCGVREGVVMLSGDWKDLLTNERFTGNITVYPGQVLLLEFQREERLEEEGQMDYQQNYRRWIDSPAVDEQTKEELTDLAGNDEEIRERFTAMLDFGTAGLRGIMRAGLSGMNVYTVRYATQGLANLILTCGEDRSGGVTIAYDSRNNSALFASEAAGVLAANGIRVNLFDELRPTPELSFAIRETHSIAGINITASHNTKEYNGYKVYWSDGAQLPPEHAAEVSAQLEEIDIFDGVKTMTLATAESAGLITMLGTDMDEKYLARVKEQSVAEDFVRKEADDLTIIYTPFHGTGYRLVPEILSRIGMKHVLTVPEQMVIDGNFPTVKSPNPEFVEGFKIAIDMARVNNVDLIIGTDPDGDRCGIVVRNGDQYETLTGNQIGVLLLDFLIRVRRDAGTLAPNSAAVKSIVSTTMANRICDVNGVKLFETLTGFKFIGEKIKEFEEDGSYTFLFGFEESNGYLSGTYARDKDAVVASMLIAEAACWYRAQGMNLYEAMQALYRKYGWYREKVVSVTFPGLDGKEKMADLMDALRKEPPKAFGELNVVRIRDYQTGRITAVADGSEEPTGLPESNVLFYDLEDGCSAVIRPSGTEPKVKLYVMVRADDAAAAEERLNSVLDAGVKMMK